MIKIEGLTSSGAFFVEHFRGGRQPPMHARSISPARLRKRATSMMSSRPMVGSSLLQVAPSLDQHSWPPPGRTRTKPMRV